MASLRDRTQTEPGVVCQSEFWSQRRRGPDLYYGQNAPRGLLLFWPHGPARSDKTRCDDAHASTGCGETGRQDLSGPAARSARHRRTPAHRTPPMPPNHRRRPARNASASCSPHARLSSRSLRHSGMTAPRPSRTSRQWRIFFCAQMANSPRSEFRPIVFVPSGLHRMCCGSSSVCLDGMPCMCAYLTHVLSDDVWRNAGVHS